MPVDVKVPPSSHLYHDSDALEKQDILEEIFKCLEDEDIARAALVCRLWNHTVQCMPKRPCTISIDANAVRTWPSSAQFEVMRKSGTAAHALDTIDRIQRARRYVNALLACPWRGSACTSLSVDMRSFFIPVVTSKAGQQATEAVIASLLETVEASVASHPASSAPGDLSRPSHISSPSLNNNLWSLDRNAPLQPAPHSSRGQATQATCALQQQHIGTQVVDTQQQQESCDEGFSNAGCSFASLDAAFHEVAAVGAAREAAEERATLAEVSPVGSAAPSCSGRKSTSEARSSDKMLWHAVMCDAHDSCDAAQRAVSRECEATVQITCQMLCNIQRNFRNITHLHLTTHRMQLPCSKDSLGWTTLSQEGTFPHLQSLSIRESSSVGSWIDFDHLAQLIRNCKGTLERLELVPRSDFPASFIEHITSDGPKVKALTFQSGQLLDCSLEALARAFGPSLSTLDLTFTSQTGGWSWRGFAAICAHCSLLTSLGLCGCNLGSNEMAPAVGAFPSLRFLDISWAQRRLDGDMIYAIVNSMPSLQHIKMYKETPSAMMMRADLQRLEAGLFEFHPNVSVQPLTDHRLPAPPVTRL